MYPIVFELKCFIQIIISARAFIVTNLEINDTLSVECLSW